jgi:hypothetical protein
LELQNTAPTDKGIKDVAAKLETVVPPRLTPKQQLTSQRYASLLVRGKPIPKILKDQVKQLPPEPPPSLAMEDLIREVMEGVDGKSDIRVRGRK